MDLAGYIEVTEVNPRLIIQVAYSGSRPQGLGFLHAKPGGLDEATITQIMEHAEKYGRGIDMDYVHGRAVKLRILQQEGRRYVDLDWYDHSREALKQLVRECGVPDVEARIAKAEAEKDEKARAYAARCEVAARAFVKLAADNGGCLKSTEAPFADYYKRPEADPLVEAIMYGREKAIDSGWVSASEDWRTFTLTESGKSLLAESETA